MNKNICFLLSALAFGLFASCSPDPDVADQQSNNAQDQLKVVRLEVNLSNPIHGLPNGASSFQNFLSLNGGGLDGSIPGDIGETTYSSSYSMAPGSNFSHMLWYWDYYYTPNQTPTYLCNTVTLKIYANDVLFHSETKELGGMGSDAGALGSCENGYSMSGNVIVPN